MAAAPEPRRELRFACTRCGACCNRSPEVLLSEAAGLADLFVFRLMFRLYALPRRSAGPADAHYQSKRLLDAFAAHSWPVKRRPGANAIGQTNYLTISALTLETGSGACAALDGGGCTIYERRPLACRTVPFHYSRAEASAERDLAAFVATGGYRCDTSEDAPVVLAEGRIVDPRARQARADALALAGRERRWQRAILRRLRTDAGDGPLPGLREIEANAAFGVTTVSMRAAWRIAAEAGVIDPAQCRSLVAAQARLIDKELAAPGCPPAARETLAEMRAEYRLANQSPDSA
jgi:Fe-S-cluster containining protein